MRVLATRADVAVAIISAPTEAALALAIADADGVILVLERPRLTAEMVRAAPRLRVVRRCGAGYDNIDVTALTGTARIPLATSGAANADAVAEHALYLMLALAKRGPLLDRAVKGGGWPREFGAVELRDRTCLVVGYGAIGRRIARLAAAFSMRVVVADPHRGSDAAAGRPPAASLDQALPEADFVVLACALTPTTRGLIDAARLAGMRPTRLSRQRRPRGCRRREGTRAGSRGRAARWGRARRSQDPAAAPRQPATRVRQPRADAAHRGVRRDRLRSHGSQGGQRLSRARRPSRPCRRYQSGGVWVGPRCRASRTAR